jgi:hypothetical protein
MSETNKNKLTAFLDYVGRTIVGEITEETETHLKIKNPVILSMVTTPDNRMSIQLFPLIFREFLADKDTPVIFDFNKNHITLTNIEALDFRLQAQYSQIFNANNVYVPNNQQSTTSQTSNTEDPNVVKLFDE